MKFNLGSIVAIWPCIIWMQMIVMHIYFLISILSIVNWCFLFKCLILQGKDPKTPFSFISKRYPFFFIIYFLIFFLSCKQYSGGYFSKHTKSYNTHKMLRSSINNLLHSQNSDIILDYKMSVFLEGVCACV